MDNNVLIVIDAQNDFIDGTFRNEDAIKVIPKIKDFIKKFNGKIIFTMDSHDENYLNTYEGKLLPIKHCIKGTKGIEINSELIDAALRNNGLMTIQKNTFGDIKKLPYEVSIEKADKIFICGFDTDICVVSNALILRAFYPNKDIIILKDLCAGSSKETHKAALTVMKSCQINIK